MPGTELILPDGSTVAVRDRRVVAVEHRDPRGATMRAAWQAPGQPMVPSWNAEQAFRLGYAANVIAYRCIQLRARAAAAVPFVVGRRMGDPATIVEGSRLGNLLGPPPGGPAPRLSAYKLFRWTFAQQIVTGRRAWEIETDDRGVPVAFWPLAAAKLEAIPSKGGNDWFRLFEYGPRHDPVKFKPEDVFYGWEPGGNDFRQAESQLQAARFDLSLITLCDRYSLGFLQNNAVPAAIITTTAFPNEAARRKFLQNWTSEYAGPDNAGRVALNEVGDDGDGPVGDSIDVKVLGLSAKDSRLIEQRKEVARELAIALGTPWSKLDASGRTYDNAEIEDRDWWETTILPDMQDLQDDINMQLAPRLGNEVGWFDLRKVRALARRIRPVTQEATAPALLLARIMTINEARADYGLDPVDDGDRTLTDAEVATLQGFGVSAGEGDADMREALSTLEARTAAIEERSNETPDFVAPPAEDATTGAPERREQDPEVIEQRRTRIWQASNAVVGGLEARWERSWRRMFARQQQAVLDRLTGKRGRQALGYGTDGLPLEQRADPAPQIDAEAIFTRQHWLDAQEELALDLFEETTGAGLARLSMSFGVSFDIGSPWAQEFIASRANQLAGQVLDTTYEQIQAALNEGVQAGESIDDIAARIRGVFEQATGNRAVVIARTEVISAYNGSSVLGASQLPSDVVAAQEWIATRDGRTRSAHAAVDGQVVPIGTAFDVGGDQLAYPGDPAGRARNTVQCRCFPAETLVSAGGVDAATRRWYDGELIQITTALGHELAGTPNHPVLTGSGWQPLGALKKGDSIIGGRMSDYPFGTPDVMHVPTPIGEVFDALALVAATNGGVQRTPSSSVDFHGDGRDGMVDVVAARRQLSDGDMTSLGEEFRQRVLSSGFGGDVHVSHEEADFSVAHSVDAVLLGGRSVAALDATSSQSGGDNIATGPVSFSKRLLADAGAVERDHLVEGYGNAAHAGSDGSAVAVANRAHEIAMLQFATESTGPETVGAGGLHHVGPFEVCLDRVVETRVIRWSGHVYNLSTETGMYIANGIVAHNCAVAFLTPEEAVEALAGRAPAKVEHRAAAVALRLVGDGEFNEAGFRRALEAASA